MPKVVIRDKTGSGGRTILGHPQLIEFMGICVLSLAHESELRGFDVYMHRVKNNNTQTKTNPQLNSFL